MPGNRSCLDLGCQWCQCPRNQDSLFRDPHPGSDDPPRLPCTTGRRGAFSQRRWTTHVCRCTAHHRHARPKPRVRSYRANHPVGFRQTAKPPSRGPRTTEQTGPRQAILPPQPTRGGVPSGPSARLWAGTMQSNQSARRPPFLVLSIWPDGGVVGSSPLPPPCRPSGPSHARHAAARAPWSHVRLRPRSRARGTHSPQFSPLLGGASHTYVVRGRWGRSVLGGKGTIAWLNMRQRPPRPEASIDGRPRRGSRLRPRGGTERDRRAKGRLVLDLARNVFRLAVEVSMARREKN